MTTYKRPEGTDDILPEQIPLWVRLEAVMRESFVRYGYAEIRPPMFEDTKLFYKASGDTTDVVEKQMFTVPSRSDSEDSYTFRPELTPGTLRALIQNGLFNQRSMWKVFYYGPMFRYEKPQKGRSRQFTQFGVEAVGSKDPLIDVETMAVFADILRGVGLTEYALRVNTLGCATCRGGYRDAVKAAVGESLKDYCENCRRRFDRNVFRIFDCKVERCSLLAEKLPAITDHVCPECKSHFEKVQAGLRIAKLDFAVDKRIVRGLDYYTRTVYEFSSQAIGAQNALGGGGRYDPLVPQMGGPDVGAVGFAAGAERILLALKSLDVDVVRPDFFIVSAGNDAREACFKTAQELRAAGLSGDLDFEGKSIKAQMRRANDLKARFTVIIGGDELAKGVVNVKNMEDGAQTTVTPSEAREIIGRKR